MENIKEKSNFKIMIFSLMPLVLFGVYNFGLRVFVLLGINVITAVVVEYLFQKKRKMKISKEILITAVIFTLILPPRIPYKLSVLGMIFGVFFGKCVYGGYGHNIFNPALVGRVFLHASFTKQMTIWWTKPAAGLLRGYNTFLGRSVSDITHASPMLSFKWSGEEPDLFNLAFGFVEGSIGETCSVLIILIGVFLLYKRIISKEIVFSILLTYIVLNYIGYRFTDANIINPLYGLLSGDLLFGTIIMASDPVTSPKTKEAKIAYGIIIGLVSFSIRSYSLFTGGMMFAILFGNMITPILDISIRHMKNTKSSELEGGTIDV